MFSNTLKLLWTRLTHKTKMDTVSVMQKYPIIVIITIGELSLGIYESIWPKSMQAHTMVILKIVTSLVMFNKEMDVSWFSLFCIKAIYTDKINITIRKKRYKIPAFWTCLLSVLKIWFCKGVDRVKFSIIIDKPKKHAIVVFIILPKTSKVVIDIVRRNWIIGRMHFRPLKKHVLSFSFSWKKIS